MELATKFNGEIINADALQMYRGLPIVTNKIPQDERNGIPHHLLDEVGLGDKPWTVHEFVEESSRIIEQIRSRGKLPIVVGGTNYYVFSLLFEDSTIAVEQSDTGSEAEEKGGCPQGSFAILDAPTEEIYAELQAVDPDIARTWHPKDRRKIQRSLEIWLKTGRKASEVYAEQKEAKEDSITARAPMILRFDPLIFWLDADDAVLKQRLNARVDAMIDQGLLEEVKSMRQFEIKSIVEDTEIDKTKGIWVAIGYKELGLWVDLLNSSERDDGASFEHTAAQLQLAGTDAVKAGTRQYAKRQNRWIRIRLAEHLQAADSLDKLFLLDCTDLEAWDQMVWAPSSDVLGRFLSGEKLPANTSLSKLAFETLKAISGKNKKPARQTHHCESCRKTLMSEEEWMKHLRSQGHKKVVDGMRKRAQYSLYKAKVADSE